MWDAFTKFPVQDTSSIYYSDCDKYVHRKAIKAPSWKLNTI